MFKANLTLKIKARSPGFKLVHDLYMNNAWLKCEGKIPNDSKVIRFTRNHKDDDDADDRILSLLQNSRCLLIKSEIPVYSVELVSSYILTNLKKYLIVAD